MSTFRTSVRGQETAAALLGRAVAAGRLGHAYLLHGPAGVGKAALARDFARALACADGTGCGDCGPCRRFDSGNYADYRALDSREAVLKIEEVRELILYLSRKPVEGRRRTVLVPRAERLTVEAQNALLKTLEAPPAAAVLLLTTDSTEALLETIVSRCQLIGCRALPRKLIAELLTAEGVEGQRARLLAGRADGSLARARSLAADDELLGLVDGLWASVRRGELVKLTAACAELPDRARSRELFDELARRAAEDHAAARSEGSASAAWFAAAGRELERTARLIAANVNTRLAAETALSALALSAPRG